MVRDVAAASSSPRGRSPILVSLGDGHGNFELTHDVPAGVFLSGVIGGDVTGDGLPDAVVAMTGVGAGVAVFPHDGARGFDTTGQQIQTPEGTFEGRPAPFPGAFGDIDGFGVGITDFDCNGCPDVVGVQLDGLVVFRGRGCATAP
ncbi:hypothetical protein [Sorangium sp. So ce176]|uniref:hypothetical protein n=1 Tax=Sorangium sp. So ce176 TaxID=3133286 RepID=UPI003F63A410